MKQTQVKVVLLGDSGVGKSSLLHRYVTGTFQEDKPPTLGASFMSKSVSFPDCEFKFNIWDTAGQERYKALAKMYYRDAWVAILVYALDQPASLESLEAWEVELRLHGPIPLAKLSLFPYLFLPSQPS
jgi:small GTP-binding protein